MGAVPSLILWVLLDLAPAGVDESFPEGFRLLLREDFGRLAVMLALVAVKKLALATFRTDGGKARRILCEYGTALLGTGTFWAQMLDS